MGNFSLLSTCASRNKDNHTYTYIHVHIHTCAHIHTCTRMQPHVRDQLHILVCVHTRHVLCFTNSSSKFTFVCVVSSHLQHTYAFQLKMQQKQDMVLWLYEEKTQTLFTQADDMYHYNHPDLQFIYYVIHVHVTIIGVSSTRHNFWSHICIHVSMYDN